MTQENLPAADVMSEDDFETIGDYHRSAAYHFTAAAKHHLAAAAADDDGDDDTSARQAHLAYRHQLHAVQYAEIATMESDTPDDEDEASEAPVSAAT
jgi:hypothetical protein